MHILLTNDDGIRAPGIVSLHDALIGDHPDFRDPLGLPDLPSPSVLTVAPLTVQSATSHGVTFHEPLMTEVVRVNDRMEGVAVDGRPADCVKLAVSTLWPERFGEGARPSLLISGMNAGANCGVNVIYSGTVAAAIEGAFLGLPTIAVSLMIGRNAPRYDLAARYARLAIERLLRAGLPRPHECLNVNLPVTEGEGPMPEIRVCPMNTHALVDRYERRLSPSGGAYYWATGYGLDFHATDAGSDVGELLAGRITVTPLSYDLTRQEHLERWRTRLEG